MGGPDDGAHLYPEGHVPCLDCGRVIGVDYDGYVTWHLTPVTPEAAPWMSIRTPLGAWCPGSRTAWMVPA